MLPIFDLCQQIVFLLNYRFSDVQQEIYTETNIPPRDQLINYEECLLRDIISETDTVNKYPKMSLTAPLVLVRSTAVEQCIMPDEKNFWYNETLPSKWNIYSKKLRKKFRYVVNFVYLKSLRKLKI